MAAAVLPAPLNAPRPDEAREPVYSAAVFKGNIPKEYKLKRYYTAADVAPHNSSHDCWLNTIRFWLRQSSTPLAATYRIGSTRAQGSPKRTSIQKLGWRRSIAHGEDTSTCRQRVPNPIG